MMKGRETRVVTKWGLKKHGNTNARKDGYMYGKSAFGWMGVQVYTMQGL